MISATAGTFNILHDGHKKLIDRAFECGDRIRIGLTSDKMAMAVRDDVIPFYMRKKSLEEYLARYEKPWEVYEISDVFGPREMMDETDVLVVSPETLGNANLLNKDRISRGIPEMRIEVVELVMACDGIKISSEAVLRGCYAKNGSSNVPDIVVGSLNHVKVEAVRSVMERIYGNVRIKACDVKSKVPEQPFENETRKGAVNRAKGALGEHDLAVGIEAGVFEMKDGLYDIQYCAVIDKSGKLTVGTGMGFRYPDRIAELVRGGMTVGDAMKEVYGKTDIGKKQGAIGFLSKGLIDRKTLTEQSVLAAMIPRIWDE